MRIKHQLMAFTEFTNFQAGLWMDFIGMNRGGLSMLQRPDWDPPLGRSNIAYLPPTMNCLTAAAEDIKTTLTQIDKHRTQLGLSMAIVHGDQQTYKRMLSLMIADSRVASWLLPKPGEWHFTAHFAETMLKKPLGLWSHFLGWFTRQPSRFCSETVEEDGFQIKKFDQYCVFLEVVITAATIYLSKYVPDYLLRQPMTLRHIAHASGARGACTLTFYASVCDT